MILMKLWTSCWSCLNDGDFSAELEFARRLEAEYLRRCRHVSIFPGKVSDYRSAAEVQQDLSVELTHNAAA